MLFSSMTFLFVFLPLVLCLYFLVKDKYKNTILLIFSLLFYSWGEPKYILLMIISIVVNFFLAKFLDKSSDYKKVWMALAVAFNIGLLLFFKYTNFFLENINNIFGINTPALNIILPIGISFYTFQILSYVIDVYRGKVAVQKNILTLGTYISFFPQLIAGPIVRYATIEKQLTKRTHSLKKFCTGLRRFMIGFAKKVLVANNVAIIADSVFNSAQLNEYGFLVILLGTLAYTLQIYYDFSGYSDMAIGLGKMFGFDFDENFNYPYVATSVTDFWRRWHISLSTWFRDYVYIPLGGNRCSKLKWVRNFFIVWLLTGFWHGASWNFVLWGLFYAIILLAEKLFLDKWLEKVPVLIKWLLTFVVVNIAWLLFRVESVTSLMAIFTNIFTFSGIGLNEFIPANFNLVSYSIFMVLGFVFMFPWKNIIKIRNHKLSVVKDVILIVLFILGILSLINNAYNPFIYFRF